MLPPEASREALLKMFRKKYIVNLDDIDQEDQSRRRRGLPSKEFENLGRVIELSTASLPIPDRRIIRTDAMNQRINKAARSRVPRLKS